jgi:oxygen-independent coproporphyrinogen-3 oxidase
MAGLYIHVPFCRQKCFYCDFFSIEYDSVLADRYIKALVKQALQFRDRKISSIYIGGGTPSVLSLKQIETLLRALNDIFSISLVREFTFELNPESILKEKLSLVKRLGVNRLSMGLQSTEDRFLKFLGRVHNFKTFCSVYDMAREEDFNNINIDLLYGLPNQTVKECEQIIKKILFLNSEHLSFYPLSIEQGTPFYKNGMVVDSDIQRDMYDKIAEILMGGGYSHYEISNWAKRGRESLHNANYWRNCEYVGLGAGAAGYLERKRYKNVENVRDYISLLENDYSVEFESEYIDDRLYEMETIILGLRLLNEGVDVKCFNNPKHYVALLECLENGTLERKSGKIRLSKEYIFVFNQIVSKFV